MSLLDYDWSNLAACHRLGIIGYQERPALLYQD